MKKMSIICLACAFLMSTLVCPVFAVANSEESITTSSYSRQQIIDIAADAFPIHKDAIKSFEDISVLSTDNMGYSGRSIQDNLIVNETASLSDGDTVVYQKYASGRAFIFIVNCGKVNSTSTSYETYTDYSVDLHAVCSFSSDAFLINGFRHRCTTSNYDSILSRGSLGGTVAFTYYDDYLLSESGTSEPYACYIATFNTSVYVNENITVEDVYNAYITVTINDGSLSIDGY